GGSSSTRQSPSRNPTQVLPRAGATRTAAPAPISRRTAISTPARVSQAALYVILSLQPQHLGQLGQATQLQLGLLAEAIIGQAGPIEPGDPKAEAGGAGGVPGVAGDEDGCLAGHAQVARHQPVDARRRLVAADLV